MRFREAFRYGYRNGLRVDRDGFSTGATVGILVGGMLAVLIGYILIPVVATGEYLASKNSTTVGNATRTGIAGASGLIPLGGLLFILAVIVVPVILVLVLIKMAE